jgi:hypothetical protein
MRETCIARPSQNAPFPRAAHHRRLRAGEEITPTMGWSFSTSAINVP